jgi:hypothetical protein
LKDKHDKEGIVLGRYYYDAENGPSLQRFKPQVCFEFIGVFGKSFIYLFI